MANYNFIKKINLIFLIMSVAFIVSGCCDKCAEEIPIEEIKPLTLNKQVVLLDKDTPVGKLHINSGNGGYTLVFPKQIYVDNAKLDYSESIVRLSIDNDDNIVIERKLLTDQIVDGFFLLKDSKEQKRMIAVEQTNMTGMYDMKEIESHFMNDPDFWQ